MPSSENTLKDLLTWKDPKKSGFLFLTMNLLFIFVVIGRYSFVTIFTYFILFFLFFGTLFNLVWNFLNHQLEGKEAAKADDEDYEFVGRETIEHLFVKVYVIANTFVQYLRDIVMLKSITNTIQKFVLLFFIAFFGQIFSDVVLIWLGCILAFVLPKVYEINKPVIDAQFTRTKEMASGYKELAFKSIPKYADIKRD